MDLLDLALVTPERPRPISRKEYDRMVELGILEQDEKVELLRGVIVTMSPQGAAHTNVIVWLNRELVLALGERYDVRPHGPYAADDWSEPEPDFAVTRKDLPRDEHPSEALLVVEVAVSSLHKDRNAKLRIYADNGVPEYWVIDVERSLVEVFTEPASGGYRVRQVLGVTDVLRPTQLPGVEIPLADLPR